MPDKTRTYRRERYYQVLELRKPRPETAIPHVEDVMTRWLHRGVRDQAVVMGTARVETRRDFVTDQKMLVAVANAYQGVHPDDAAILGHYVDDERGQMVVVPILTTPPIRLSDA